MRRRVTANRRSASKRANVRYCFVVLFVFVCFVSRLSCVSDGAELVQSMVANVVLLTRVLLPEVRTVRAKNNNDRFLVKHRL